MDDGGGKLATVVKDGIDALVRRFDLIIGLLIEGPRDPSAEDNAEDKSVRLARIGMRPVEIARLTGRHESNVNRDLSRARTDGRLAGVPNTRAASKALKRRKSHNLPRKNAKRKGRE